MSFGTLLVILNLPGGGNLHLKRDPQVAQVLLKHGVPAGIEQPLNLSHGRRFLKEEIHSGAKALAEPLGLGSPGQHGDGAARVGLRPADVSRQLQAVHFRHLPVQEYPVEFLSIDQFGSLATGLSAVGCCSTVLEHFTQKIQKCNLVIYHQDLGCKDLFSPPKSRFLWPPGMTDTDIWRAFYPKQK